MTTEVQSWLDGLLPERRDDAEWFAAAVRNAIPKVDEAVKWGRLTFTVDGDWHHWLCGIAATKVSREAADGQATALTALLIDAVAHQHDMLDD